MLRALELRPTDRLVILGDVVDRGPDTRGVIDRLIALRENCELTVLRGNHEEMMLGAMLGKTPVDWWLECGGKTAVKSYNMWPFVPHKIPRAHRQFLQSTQQFFETEDYFFVHANYVADEPLDNQPAEALRWQSLDHHWPEPHQSGKTAILGHTAQPHGEVLDAGYFRCLDTYCHGGGWLTAMEVRTGEVWQADREGMLRVL